MDQSRYSRQIAVPNFGEEGQQKLLSAKVAVVGAGGVKSPMLFYLAAAGVGTILIVDFDHVELSNLNRQILYRTEDIGKPKAVVAADRLRALNPEILIQPVVERVDDANFEALMTDSDLLIEGGDSAAGRRVFNKNALKLAKTYIHASAQYNYAYVFTVVPGRSACFDCVFGDLPDTHGGPVPVLGPVAGIAGSVAAGEAISMLCGKGPNLSQHMYFYDGWSGFSCLLEKHARANCESCSKEK